MNDLLTHTHDEIITALKNDLSEARFLLHASLEKMKTIQKEMQFSKRLQKKKRNLKKNRE